MKASKNRRISPVWLGVLASVCVVMQAGSASAQTWNFCSPPKTTTIEYNTPSALLMLDRSGSMGPSLNNLWGIAKSSLKSVVQTLTSSEPDQVRFGLGFFPNKNSSSGAYISFEAKDNAYASLVSTLDSTSPSGGTPTADAINRISSSATLQPANKPAAGILITDGEPSGGEQAPLNAACDMRNAGKSLYVVGLGGKTDTQFNNKLAAAAGKGCCGPSANPTCSNGIGTDPCANSSIGKSTCYGSYEAYNEEEFTNVLLGIANEISCTFDLDVDLHPSNQAPENPEAVLVRMQSAGGLLSIPHRTMNASMAGEGWFFSNENRNTVTLTPHYCGMIQAGDAEFVDTQVACPCVQEIGTACDVPGPLPPLICPQGVWSCDSGFDVCEPVALEHCPVACPGYDLGAPCHMDDVPVSVTGVGAHDPAREVNRCKVGEVACVNNTTPVCQALFGPMPELCDGLDNDCDGIVDNIAASWGKTVFATYEIAAEHENAGAACFERDACVCSTPLTSFNHYAPLQTPVDGAAEYALYLNSWNPEFCECREGLSR